MTIIRNSKGNFSAMQKTQKAKTEVNGSCGTICQPYSVPGGCTPRGTKCIMYCAGK